METGATNIAERLDQVNETMARACQRAGRSVDDVTLVAVSKTFPLHVIHDGIEVGLRHFGENRVQDLVHKAAEIPGKWNGGSIDWHMIGHLQRNKAKDMIASTDLFHALDSVRLAREINKRAAELDRVIPCLIQINVSDEATKFGFDPKNLEVFVDEIEHFDRLQIQGLMTLAAPVIDPEEVRPQFSKLRKLFENYQNEKRKNLRMDYLSMGMSGDYVVAIEEGATHIRIGSAIFGPRR